MSTWTHVSATIRIDAIRHFPTEPLEFGKTCNYSSSQEEWTKCDVPCGSEGSLQYQIWTNPNENSTAAYTCMIWGDLRDYDNVDEIKEYLNKIIRKQVVRQGVAEIEVTDGKLVILQVQWTSRDEQEWVEVLSKG